MLNRDKIPVVVGALLLFGTIAWAWISDLSGGRADFENKITQNREFPVDQTVPPSVAPLDWGKPTPQKGANWIFDIFTPPVIYYDGETETFTVTPPFPNAIPSEDPFELKLVKVSRQPFRLQLVSYAGAIGNYLLTLENLESGRDIFCAPGDDLIDLGVRILEFKEKRLVAASAGKDSTEAFDLVGEVLVEDLESGKSYRLRHNEMTFLDESIAEFRIPSGQQLRLSQGDSWSSEVATYRVNSIESGEGSVRVERTLTDVGDKEVKLLQPLSSFNTQDQSDSNPRPLDPTPGTF